MLYIAGILFPVVPLLLIFFKNPLALIFIPGIVSGFANAAFVIGRTNFIYDSVTPQQRGLVVAYTSILVGIGIFVGSLIGGVFVEYVNFGFMKPILFVFLISAVLRALGSLFYLPQLKEVRKTERLRGLYVNLLHPFRMMPLDVGWFKNFLYPR